MPESLREAVEKNLTTRHFGRPIQVLAETTSTNDVVKSLALAGAPEGTAVAALSQTAGRGRRGRSFCSPAGGLYLSFLLRPTEPISPGLITACGAVVAARAIRRVCGAEVEIKWVNDLLLSGRKVCGILAEGLLDPATGSLSAVVVGMGLNLSAVPLPAEVAAVATSLEAEGYGPVSLSALLVALLEEAEAAYATMETGEFLAEYRRRSAVVGRRITVHRGEEHFSALAQCIDDRARLVVDTDDGVLTLSSGEVSIRL